MKYNNLTLEGLTISLELLIKGSENMVYLQNQKCTEIMPLDGLLKINERDGVNKKRYTLELNCHELANYSTEEEAKKALEYVYKRINLGCAIVQLPK